MTVTAIGIGTRIGTEKGKGKDGSARESVTVSGSVNQTDGGETRAHRLGGGIAVEVVAGATAAEMTHRV